MYTYIYIYIFKYKYIYIINKSDLLLLIKMINNIEWIYEQNVLEFPKISLQWINID